MEASKCIGGIHGYPLSLTKLSSFVLCMYRGHPHVWGHIDIPLVLTKHASFVLCICTGGIHTSSKHMEASKHMGGVQAYREAYGAIQTYGDIPTLRGHSKIQGASKCMGAYGHPLSLTKHAFFVLCMYKGHPNI